MVISPDNSPNLLSSEKKRVTGSPFWLSALSVSVIKYPFQVPIYGEYCALLKDTVQHKTSMVNSVFIITKIIMLF